MKTLRDIAVSAGLNPFRERTRTLYDVQTTTATCTHFYDAGTLRFFGYRLSKAREFHDGLILGTIGIQDRGFMLPVSRGYVVHFHFCDGTHISNETTSKYFDSLRDAGKVFDRLVASYDPACELRDAIIRKRDYAKRAQRDTSAALRTLGKRGTK